jgi:hypothetical protein
MSVIERIIVQKKFLKALFYPNKQQFIDRVFINEDRNENSASCLQVIF